ncbi:MAG: hypothetical protein PWP31_1459 [Clostridia bacterium]|nr:hypothetical protein [Clostridia bacterium]
MVPERQETKNNKPLRKGLLLINGVALPGFIPFLIPLLRIYKAIFYYLLTGSSRTAVTLYSAVLVIGSKAALVKILTGDSL